MHESRDDVDVDGRGRRPPGPGPAPARAPRPGPGAAAVWRWRVVHVADAAAARDSSRRAQGELARYAHLCSHGQAPPSPAPAPARAPPTGLAAARALALRDSAPNAAVTAVLRVDAAGALAGVELFRSLLPPVRRLTHAAADARLRGGGGAAVSDPEEWDGQDAALGALAAGGEVEATTALRGGAAGAVAHWGLLALERAAAATPGRLVPATVARVLDARRGVYAVRAGAGAGATELTVRGRRGLEPGAAVSVGAGRGQGRRS
eukprot:tig00000760_g3939.t1